MVEIIEGEATEVALTVIPREELAGTRTPENTLELATRMATSLSDIVERQRLYTVIQGRKFPQVEAWMTIARMDNVVAREAQAPIRHDDGSYEAFVELIRLSDGMIVGSGSALCGAPDDEPWGGTPSKYGKAAKPPRPEHQRRSMAVTRATSRAFRQQYSWIMALAGYEPTPADEMPGNREEPREAVAETTHENGLTGNAVAVGTQDFELRQSPDGWTLPFRVKEGAGAGVIVVAHDELATALAVIRDGVIGQRVTVWGTFKDESFAKGTGTVRYRILHLERIQTPDAVLPAPDGGIVAPVEAETAAMFAPKDDDLTGLDF